MENTLRQKMITFVPSYVRTFDRECGFDLSWHRTNKKKNE